jgi:small subunit ribosomal protein S16
MGSTNRPFYRLVAIDSRNRRDGRCVAELGWYDPLKKPSAVHFDEEPILEWLRRGAEPSPTVRELMRDQGILLKWELLQRGVAAPEATQQVAAALAKRTPREKKRRPSKKAAAKAGAPAAAASA